MNASHDITNIFSTILMLSNYKPNTCKPVGDEDEADDQEAEDDCAILS